MQVWVELALLENFCMDFTLLTCAKLVCKNPASYKRIAAVSALGSCFAVVYPLFGIDGAVLSAAIKLAAGIAMCALSGKFKKFKSFLKLTAVFAGFTALLGGAIIAVFTLTGWDYAQGSGYMLASVPVGIPLFFALMLVIFARKLAQKLKKVGKTTVRCRLFAGDKSVEIEGFFDSGNKVYLSGQPVSVIPLTAALKIADLERIKQEVKIHTVAGSKKLKVFTADKVEICEGEKIRIFRDVKIGISAKATGQAVLHPDLMEE